MDTGPGFRYVYLWFLVIQLKYVFLSGSRFLGQQSHVLVFKLPKLML